MDVVEVVDVVVGGGGDGFVVVVVPGVVVDVDPGTIVLVVVVPGIVVDVVVVVVVVGVVPEPVMNVTLYISGVMETLLVCRTSLQPANRSWAHEGRS